MDKVVELLLAQRKRIDDALAILAPVKRGRPPATATTPKNSLTRELGTRPVTSLAPRGRTPGSKDKTARKPMSKAHKRAVARGIRKYWAGRKAA